MKTLFCVLTVLPFSATSQKTDQDWWFNVEIILFKRDLLPSNTEDFSQTNINIINKNANPVLFLKSMQQQGDMQSYFDHLPFCDGAQQQFVMPIDFNLTDIPILSNTDFRRINYPINIENDNGHTERENYATVDDQENLDKLIGDLDSQTRKNQVNSTRDTENNDNINENQSQVNDFRSISQQSNNDNKSPAYGQKTPIDVSALRKREGQSLYSYIMDLTEGYKVHSKNSDVDLLVHHVNSTANLNANLIDLGCRNAMQQTRFPSSIGERIFAPKAYFKDKIHLVHESELKMADYAKQVFNQRDIQPLLYAAYRDNIVFGIDNAPYIRLVAGELLTTSDSTNRQSYNEYKEQFEQIQKQTEISLDGNEQSVDNKLLQSNFFEDLEKAIAENQPVDWSKIENTDEQQLIENTNSLQQAFEVDGVFKVYLEYVNQIPYLHIDSELNHARLNIDNNGDSQLTIYPFKQRRRIISKQIHYFDHPAFGMIVRLERFSPPTPINGEPKTLTTNE